MFDKNDCNKNKFSSYVKIKKKKIIIKGWKIKNKNWNVKNKIRL